MKQKVFILLTDNSTEFQKMPKNVKNVKKCCSKIVAKLWQKLLPKNFCQKTFAKKLLPKNLLKNCQKI
jgi:hypothetical protein